MNWFKAQKWIAFLQLRHLKLPGDLPTCIPHTEDNEGKKRVFSEREIAFVCSGHKNNLICIELLECSKCLPVKLGVKVNLCISNSCHS